MSETRIDFAAPLERELARELIRIWLRQNWVVSGLYIGATLVALVLGQTEPERGAIVLGYVASFGAAIMGLKVMSRIVGAERTGGLFLIWLQKPGLLLRAYALRYAWFLALAFAVFAVVVPMIVLGAVEFGGFDRASALRVGLTVFAWGGIAAAATFAFSCWGVQDDAIYAFIVLFALFSFGAVFSFDDSLYKIMIRSILSPADAITKMVRPDSVPYGYSTAALVIVAHFAAWTAFGFVGLKAAAAK